MSEFNAPLPPIFAWNWQPDAQCPACKATIYIHQRCYQVWMGAGMPALDCSKGHRARGPVCEAVGLKVVPGSKQTICLWALWESETSDPAYLLISYQWKPGLEPEWLCRACNGICQSLERPRTCPHCHEVSSS